MSHNKEDSVTSKFHDPVRFSATASTPTQEKNFAADKQSRVIGIFYTKVPLQKAIAIT